jgi:hypothetical protein
MRDLYRGPSGSTIRFFLCVGTNDNTHAISIFRPPHERRAAVTLATTLVFLSRPMSCPLPHMSYSPTPSHHYTGKLRLQPYTAPAPDNTSYLYTHPSMSVLHTPPCPIASSSRCFYGTAYRTTSCTCCGRSLGCTSADTHRGKCCTPVTALR